MRRAWSSFATISLAAINLAVPAAPAPAATVLERHIHVTLENDGTVREASHLKVRLDHQDDVASWSTHQVALYDNRTLERLDARVALPDGSVVTLGPDDQDTVEGAGGGFFHTSLRLHRARFRDLKPGAVLTIGQEVTVRPYYRTGRVLVRGAGPVGDLRVVVDAEGGAVPEGWRWSLQGPALGLVVEEDGEGVTIHGRDLTGLAVPELAPAGGAARPVLRYGWGTDGTWDDVGRWYHELAVSVPRATAAIRSEARQLTAELSDPRQRLDTLVGFLQNKVRNVAVLIGDGNYRPSPPGDVLERKWGDCKDKAMLLVDLLRSVQVEAYPALIHKNARQRIDPAFPSPDQFNHAIVAVPRDAVTVHADDPVAGGYLFIDTTQEAGAGRWLDPDSQDQDVLVVRPDSAELVRTPLRPDLEHRRLSVDLAVADGGDARGRARLEIRGEIAYDMIRRIGDLGPEQLAEEARSILAHLLPGTALDDLSWSTTTAAVPSVELTAAVALPGLVQGRDGSRSFVLPGMRATPDPQLLRDRSFPMALPARSARVTWNLALPEDWCPPVARDDAVANDVGVFRQTVVSEDAGQVTLDRQVELRRRWVAGEELAALRELALAEHRAHRRRTRLRCGGQG